MFKKILVPLDGSSLAESVLPYIEEIDRRWEGPTIILLKVIPPLPYVSEERIGIGMAEEEMEKESKNYMETMAASLMKKGMKVEWKVTFGRVAETIITFAEDNQADLIAMSTHGYSGIQRWILGSVAEKVLRGSGKPVLLIRPKTD